MFKNINERTHPGIEMDKTKNKMDSSKKKKKY